MWRFMSYGKEYLRSWDGVKCVANFYQIIRILRVNFSHHFAKVFQHFVIFCVNEFEKFIFSSVLASKNFWGRRRRRKRSSKKKQGVKGKTVNQNEAWVTNILEMKWGSGRKKKSKKWKKLFLQITQIKTSLLAIFLSLSLPSDALENIFFRKWKIKKRKNHKKTFLSFTFIPANESFSCFSLRLRGNFCPSFETEIE